MGVLDGDHLALAQEKERPGAADTQKGGDERLEEVVALGLRDLVEDDFAVGGALEDGAVVFELAAQLGGIDQVAVVRNGERAAAVVDEERLGVGDAVGAGGGIADVAHRHVAGQLVEPVAAEDLVDEPLVLEDLELVAVAGDDPGALLAAMLKGIEAEVDHLGGLGMTEDADDAALFARDFRLKQWGRPLGRGSRGA